MSDTKTILIVEDDEIYRDTLKDKLTHEGFMVYACENGKEAIEQTMQNKEIDLILLDMVMPEMDGAEFAYHVDKTLNQSIPIFILTNLESIAVPDRVNKVFIKAETSLDQIVTEIHDTLG